MTHRRPERCPARLTILFVLASSLLCAMTSSAQDTRPNVLFIMTDQQSAHMMSCTGNTWLQTPSLDRLAASGIRFERAYASNPICAPNRFSLQTGLMPSAVGMRVNQDDKHAKVTKQMVRHSLGNLFRDAGYETVYGGKVHLPHRMLDLETIGYRLLTADSRQELADASVRFIQGQHTKPFLLFASFINPHDICYMGSNDYRRSLGKGPEDNRDSREFEKLYERIRQQANLANFIKTQCPPLPNNHDIAVDEPDIIEDVYIGSSEHQFYLRGNWSENEWRLHRWAYCRLTEMVDEKIGQLLDALEEAGLEDKTLVVFTSDHGDMDGAHQLVQKAVLYEESVRIPFIMSYKHVIPRGVVDTTHLISNGLDLLPTLCEFAGIAVPEGLPGASLKGLAEGRAIPGWRDHLVVESQSGRMVRTDRFKYSVYESGDHREQLIDLLNDPGEMNSLAGDSGYGSVVARHRSLLRGWIERTGDRIGSEYLVGE